MTVTTELRPLIASATRHALGMALGLGIAWHMVAGAVLSLGSADSSGLVFSVRTEPLALSGLEITLQR